MENFWSDHGPIWTLTKTTGVLLIAAGAFLHQLTGGATVPYALGSTLGAATGVVLLIVAATLIRRYLSWAPPDEVALLPVRWFQTVFLLAATLAALQSFWTFPPVTFVWMLEAFWALAVVGRYTGEFVNGWRGVSA